MPAIERGRLVAARERQAVERWSTKRSRKKWRSLLSGSKTTMQANKNKKNESRTTVIHRNDDVIMPKSRMILALLSATIMQQCLISSNLIKLNAGGSGQAEALRISNFYVPAFVPTNLAQIGSGELSKPILLDCDYEYSREEDTRLAVKWFKNKEAEPFYQWLPELNVRHFADWIRPLVNVSFITEPHDPFKRYRSLLVKRLSMNLTGSYSCVVSSLAGQDMHEAALVVYAPPRSLTFEHRLFPAPAQLMRADKLHGTKVGGPSLGQRQQFGGPQQAQPSPTQFRGQQQQAGIVVVRPPNNEHHLFANQSSSALLAAAAAAAAAAQAQATPHKRQQLASQDTDTPAPNTNAAEPTMDQNTKIVYTHDGRPIRRKQKRQTTMETNQLPLLSHWQLKQRLTNQPLLQANNQPTHRHTIQLHYFQCQATQVHPRPVLVLTVKRQADSIAQYLHEASSFAIRPYQIEAHELLAATSEQQPALSASAKQLSGNKNQQTITVFDVTVSATIALNVSLLGAPDTTPVNDYSGQITPSSTIQQQQALGVNTVLQFRRGQRMTFECHLEITGTDYGRRERITINETEVYQAAEQEEARRRQRANESQQQRNDIIQQNSGLLANLVASSSNWAHARGWPSSLTELLSLVLSVGLLAVL